MVHFIRREKNSRLLRWSKMHAPSSSASMKFCAMIFLMYLIGIEIILVIIFLTSKNSDRIIEHTKITLV